MIKAIIFDCFGVLTTGTLDILCSLFPMHCDTIRGRIKTFDLGSWSLEQFAAVMADITGASQQDILGEILTARKISTRNKKLLSEITNLKNEYKIGLLSNIGERIFEVYFTPEERSNYFDSITLSYQEKIAKPDPRIYKLAAKRLGVGLDECVFVDDKESNVRAAEKLGMKGIVYRDFEYFMQQLNGILGSKNA